MITFLDFIVIVAVLGFAYWGWLVGLETASIAALELVACLGLAVVLHESVAGWLHAAAAAVVGEWASQAWSVLLAFALLAWGAFAAIRLGLHPASGEDAAAAAIDPLGDRLGGAVAGGFGGVLFAGGILVTLSMIPFLAWLKPSGDRMRLDVGKTVLRSGGDLAGERHEGRSVPLWGEPASRSSNAAARLASEPWVDVDGDGKFTDADRYRDVDGSGTFTKDLYFDDVDGDGLRRVGLIDKYVAGRWDGGLISEDRPRPDATRPAAPPAPRKPAAPPPKTTPPKTPPTGATPAGKPPATKPEPPKKPEDKPKADGADEPEPTDEKRPEDDF